MSLGSVSHFCSINWRELMVSSSDGRRPAGPEKGRPGCLVGSIFDDVITDRGKFRNSVVMVV